MKSVVLTHKNDHLVAFSDVTYQHCNACPCQPRPNTFAYRNDDHSDRMDNHVWLTPTQVLAAKVGIGLAWKEAAEAD